MLGARIGAAAAIRKNLVNVALAVVLAITVVWGLTPVPRIDGAVDAPVDRVLHLSVYGEDGGRSCSAFLVDGLTDAPAGHLALITAEHCLPGESSELGLGLGNRIQRTRGGLVLLREGTRADDVEVSWADVEQSDGEGPVQLAVRNVEADLLLLWVDTDALTGPHRVYTLAAARPEPGDPLTLAGYPASSGPQQVACESNGVSAYLTSGTPEDEFNGAMLLLPQSLDCPPASTAAYQGASGGPILNAQDEVVGVAQQAGGRGEVYSVQLPLAGASSEDFAATRAVLTEGQHGEFRSLCCEEDVSVTLAEGTLSFHNEAGTLVAEAPAEGDRLTGAPVPAPGHEEWFATCLLPDAESPTES